jgi:hypothetical protein
MNTKTILKLVLVLGGLILLWLGQAWWSNRQAGMSSGWTKLDTGVKVEEIDKIKVEVDKNNFEFTKSEEVWKLGEMKANQERVQSLVDLLKSPEVELVSQSQDRHTELGVGNENANKVGYFVGDEEKFGLLVEKNLGQLIRQMDKQNVYKLKSGLSLSGDKDSWLEATESASVSPEPEEE